MQAQERWDDDPISTARLAWELGEAIDGEDWVLTANTLEEWTRKIWDFDRPYRHPGKSLGTATQIGIASELGVAPEPLVLAIMFGANFCYLTPMAYQTNLLVMSAAGYRFSDFVRGGAPLLVIMLTAYAYLLPRFFPL